MECHTVSSFTEGLLTTNVVIAPCMNPMDKQVLVSAAKEGDSDAFVALYERHSKMVLASIYRITKNREDAEDALQDAALRAFAHMKSFEGRSSFATWFTRIATNSALMVLRKRRGEEIPIEEIYVDSESSRTWEPQDARETPESYYIRRKTEERVRNAMRRLPRNLRDAIELQCEREYSTMQIAEELGISAAVAKSRLMRARRIMRQRLTGGYPDQRYRPMSPCGH